MTESQKKSIYIKVAVDEEKQQVENGHSDVEHENGEDEEQYEKHELNFPDIEAKK